MIFTSPTSNRITQGLSLKEQRTLRAASRTARWIPALALSLACSLCFADPQPRSLIFLHFLDGSVRAQLRLPLEALQRAVGEKVLDRDGSTAGHLGALAEYLEGHVQAFASDGSLWSVRVRALSRQAQNGRHYILANLDLRPPASMPATLFRFNYDVITREVPSHTALVSVASDWRDGIYAQEPLWIGVLRSPVASMIIDRSHGSPWHALLGLAKTSVNLAVEHVNVALLLLLLPLVCSGLRSRRVLQCCAQAACGQLVSLWSALGNLYGKAPRHSLSAAVSRAPSPISPNRGSSCA